MQRALIIGASGGIGAALASELSARGVDVVGLSRSVDGLDVTDQASVQAVMGQLEGHFDLIIMASGILAPSGESPEKSLRSIKQASLEEVMAVNAIGPSVSLAEIPPPLPADGRSAVPFLPPRGGPIGDISWVAGTPTALPKPPRTRLRTQPRLRSGDALIRRLSLPFTQARLISPSLRITQAGTKHPRRKPPRTCSACSTVCRRTRAVSSLIGLEKGCLGRADEVLPWLSD